MAEKSAKEIHQGHRKRVKQRIINEGLSGFEPHEIMEAMLFFSIANGNTNEIGHRLIDEFGSVKGVLDADYNSLLNVKGIGENSAALIVFFRKLASEYMKMKSADADSLSEIRKMKDYCKALFLGESDEKFYLICLDNNLRIIKDILISEGGINSVSVNPRFIVENIIKYKITCVAITHNHPRGSELPSTNDICVTRSIGNTLRGIEVKLIDHIIIGMNNDYSMKENGILMDVWS